VPVVVVMVESGCDAADDDRSADSGDYRMGGCESANVVGASLERGAGGEQG
jgi:hypothetical protein